MIILDNVEQITISTEYIKLQQLLKLAGVVDQGSDAKIFILQGKVKVNDVIATERGKKIRPGDLVQVEGMAKLEVIIEE